MVTPSLDSVLDPPYPLLPSHTSAPIHLAAEFALVIPLHPLLGFASDTSKTDGWRHGGPSPSGPRARRRRSRMPCTSNGVFLRSNQNPPIRCPSPIGVDCASMIFKHPSELSLANGSLRCPSAPIFFASSWCSSRAAVQSSPRPHRAAPPPLVLPSTADLRILADGRGPIVPPLRGVPPDHRRARGPARPSRGFAECQTSDKGLPVCLSVQLHASSQRSLPLRFALRTLRSGFVNPENSSCANIHLPASC